jgi:adenine-specific DNA-methyltransferase
MQGDNFQLDKEPLLEIPIKNTNKSIQKSIKELVDKIIKAKEVDIDSETKFFEDKVDSLVFELYELTKEDIQFIEQNLKNGISVEQYEAVNVE